MPPVLLLLTLALADDPGSPDGPPPPAAVRVEDAGELQGEWEVVSLFIEKLDYSKASKGDRWVFAGTSVRLIHSNGHVFGPHAIRVNAACDPSEFEYSDQGNRIRGIYRRSGDELLLAEDRYGDGPRPSSFEPANRVVLWTLRRVKN